MSALAVETVAPPRLRLVTETPPAAAEIESWELHSELAVVSPEVRRRALELLPEREPESFLVVLRPPAAATARPSEAEHALPLPVAVAAYAVVRLLQTLRSGAFFLAVCAILPLLVELLR